MNTISNNSDPVNTYEAEASLFREIEIFRIDPEEGKCYDHAEATRKEYKSGFGNGIGSRASVTRYFTTNTPEYVGQYLRTERRGSGEDRQSFYIFNRNNREHSVEASYDGMTCFSEVPCRNSSAMNIFKRGGGKRRTRRTRKKSKKTRRIK